MPSADALSMIESEGRRILDFARRDPSGAVPQYPGWTMSDLVAHVGSILGRTILICVQRPTERISAPRPPEGQDLFDWYEKTLAGMIRTLRESDLDAPVWGFIDGSTISFWVRRMVVETGIHRWDADQALGDPEPLLDLVATSGLDEYGGMWLPRLGAMPALEMTATDLGRTWTIGSVDSKAAVEGTASDLYLRLMSRQSAVALPDEWATAVDNLAAPPKP